MSFWDNLLNTLTDFFENAVDAVTDFVQDTADAVTDFLESVGTLTYGNYGGLNYSAGVVGGTITENSPPPVDAYDAAFFCTILLTKVLPTQRYIWQQTFKSQRPYLT
jgi:hypothetical protein